jgi:hypothetical protein
VTPRGNPQPGHPVHTHPAHHTPGQAHTTHDCHDIPHHPPLYGHKTPHTAICLAMLLWFGVTCGVVTFSCCYVSLGRWGCYVYFFGWWWWCVVGAVTLGGWCVRVVVRSLWRGGGMRGFVRRGVGWRRRGVLGGGLLLRMLWLRLCLVLRVRWGVRCSGAVSIAGMVLVLWGIWMRAARGVLAGDPGDCAGHYGGVR